MAQAACKKKWLLYYCGVSKALVGALPMAIALVGNLTHDLHVSNVRSGCGVRFRRLIAINRYKTSVLLQTTTQDGFRKSVG